MGERNRRYETKEKEKKKLMEAERGRENGVDDQLCQTHAD